MLIKFFFRIFGEIIGGSQREERLSALEDKMTERGVSHSGFELDLERLVQFVTGMKNIKDVALFPRTPGKL